MTAPSRTTGPLGVVADFAQYRDQASRPSQSIEPGFNGVHDRRVRTLGSTATGSEVPDRSVCQGRASARGEDFRPYKGPEPPRTMLERLRARPGFGRGG